MITSQDRDYMKFNFKSMYVLYKFLEEKCLLQEFEDLDIEHLFLQLCISHDDRIANLIKERREHG